mmetsp:Transcript_4184/g.6096  ORF Transcript_4184/g.6096 Transcript_4184/m.6096 type:complete len:196 (-) Transcript_4184:32-619(-)
MSVASLFGTISMLAFILFCDLPSVWSFKPFSDKKPDGCVSCLMTEFTPQAKTWTGELLQRPEPRKKQPFFLSSNLNSILLASMLLLSSSSPSFGSDGSFSDIDQLFFGDSSSLENTQSRAGMDPGSGMQKQQQKSRAAPATASNKQPSSGLAGGDGLDFLLSSPSSSPTGKKTDLELMLENSRKQQVAGPLTHGF